MAGDEVYYLQKYVPRRPRSRWSQVNVAKVEELIAAGRMRPSGLAEVEAAKADGRWAVAYQSQRNAAVPPDLTAALAGSPQAAQAFGALGKTRQYAVILKLLTARTATAPTAQLRKAMAKFDTRGAPCTGPEAGRRPVPVTRWTAPACLLTPHTHKPSRRAAA